MGLGNGNQRIRTITLTTMTVSNALNVLFLPGLVTIHPTVGSLPGSSFRSYRFTSVFQSHRLPSEASIRDALFLGTVFGAGEWRAKKPNYYLNDDDRKLILTPVLIKMYGTNISINELGILLPITMY